MTIIQASPSPIEGIHQVWGRDIQEKWKGEKFVGAEVKGAHLKGWFFGESAFSYFKDSIWASGVFHQVTIAHQWWGWSSSLPASGHGASLMPRGYVLFPSPLGRIPLSQSLAHGLLTIQREDAFCTWRLLCPCLTYPMWATYHLAPACKIPRCL